MPKIGSKEWKEFREEEKKAWGGPLSHDYPLSLATVQVARIRSLAATLLLENPEYAPGIWALLRAIEENSGR